MSACASGGLGAITTNTTFKFNWVYDACGLGLRFDTGEEGLFGWVTVNYLLDALYATTPPREPVGIIDLGGGSVQIVFPTAESSTAPAGYSQHLDFGGRKHGLYLKSHLGFGLDAARNAALDMLISKHEVRRAVRTLPLTHPHMHTHIHIHAHTWPRTSNSYEQSCTENSHAETYYSN